MHAALPDELAAREAEAPGDELRVAARLRLGTRRRRRATPDPRRQSGQTDRAMLSRSARTSPAARCTARPASVVERLAPVERSYGVNSVSVPRQRTRSAGIDSVSAAICANAVRWPWPISVEPTSTTASPSDSSRTTALETGCAPAARRPTESPRPCPSGSGWPQPSARRGLLDVADEVGVERLATVAYVLARVGAGCGDASRSGSTPGAPADLVDLQLTGPLQVRRSEGAVRARWRGVGVDARGVARAPPTSDTGPVRRRRRWPRRAGRCQRRRRCRRPRRRRAPAVARRGRRRCACGSVAPWRRVVAIDSSTRFMDAYRTAGLARQRHRDRLHLGVRLAAEAATEVGHDDPDPRQRHVEEVGDLGAHQEGMLAGRPHA